MKIKTGDKVKVISGHYKGTVGEVKAVSPKTNKIIVEGVNLIKKSFAIINQSASHVVFSAPYQTSTLYH